MILSVAGVEFRYNSHPVLRDVGFELERGRILAVLGVNGAGKSTLLKCINRILQPRRGVVLLNGRDVASLRGREIARGFGYVPQQAAPEPLSVFDAVLLGRKPYIRWAMSEQDYRIVERVLQLMHLEHLALRPLNALSGGETQKVLLARALAQEPDVLLLDEPMSNLDPRNQMEALRLISHVVRDHRLCAVISVHDLNLALRLGDSFLLLKDGTVHTITDREGLTPAVIREVYGIDVALAEIDGYPLMVMKDA